MSGPAISIIIPAYNRADLIAETLDSIAAQTFRDWECIITDDGSTDDTFEILEQYALKDSRFRIFKRPQQRLKGANACRNNGLDNARGKYIIFFDSDDLMTHNHVEAKWNAIESSGCDYVIARTKFFNSEKSLDHYYQFEDHEITAYNYVAQNINWLTYDVCVKSELAKSVRFNEKLQSGQEYNYFCKLVHISVNAKPINEVLTLRREHEGSIRGKLNKNDAAKTMSKIKSHWETYCDIRYVAEPLSRRLLLHRIADMQFRSRILFSESFMGFSNALIREFGWKAAKIPLALIVKKYTGKGYFLFRNLSRWTKPDDK